MDNVTEIHAEAGNILAAPKLLYTKQEAAQALAVSVRTVDNLLALKELRAIHVGKSVRIREEDLRAFTRRDHATVRSAIQ